MARTTLAGEPRTDTVTSTDGTPIGLLSFGDGPGLVVVPGSFRRAHHYTALARELSAAGPVHVVDRRGRGDSGLRGPEYGIDVEADDVAAVLAHTRSTALFGHSYGGLVALHVALRQRLTALAVYEPGVSIDGSYETSWMPEFTRLVAARRLVAAMTTFVRGSRLTPIPDGAPWIVFRALATLLVAAPGSAENRALIPTIPAEAAEIVRLDSDGSRYAAITTPTLLLGGSRTPTYLTGVLPQLAQIIPGARVEIIDGLDHNAPDESNPAAVAARLLR